MRVPNSVRWVAAAASLAAAVAAPARGQDLLKYKLSQPAAWTKTPKPATLAELMKQVSDATGVVVEVDEDALAKRKLKVPEGQKFNFPTQFAGTQGALLQKMLGYSRLSYAPVGDKILVVPAVDGKPFKLDPNPAAVKQLQAGLQLTYTPDKTASVPITELFAIFQDKLKVKVVVDMDGFAAKKIYLDNTSMNVTAKEPISPQGVLNALVAQREAKFEIVPTGEFVVLVPKK